MIYNRKIFSLLFYISVIVLSGCNLYKQYDSEQLNKPFTFIQMTDPQFGMATRDKGFELETKLFEKAIEDANKINPAFVVISGDLINKDGDKEQIAEFFRISEKLNKTIPLYLVPGNHDVNKDPTPKTIKKYRKEFGKDYYTFNFGNSYFIILNSTIFQNSEFCKEEEIKQFKWLTKVLKRSSKYQNSFVILHHPLFLEMPDEADQYFNIPKDLRLQYLELFREANIKAVFAGHYHQNSYGKYGKIEMITCGSVGKPFADDPSGFNIITISKDKTEYKYHVLEKQ